MNNKIRKILNVFTILMVGSLGMTALAASDVAAVEIQESNMMDELDPRDPNIADILNKMDAEYEAHTGLAPILELGTAPTWFAKGCTRKTCPLYVRVHLYESPQYMDVYLNGELYHQWKISSGGRGHETIHFDNHPDSPLRIYRAYTSKKYPDGDYQGLGNMPYAVFFRNGYAIHGTTKGSIPYLGQPASHGCIRVHPDNGAVLNQYFRNVGAKGSWITIQ